MKVRPFAIPEDCKLLRETYPEPGVLSEAIRSLGLPDLEAVASLWLSEGIPFGFVSTPILYEIVRRWLALRLQVEPKSITLIGSARIGYSLRRVPDYGRAFGEQSDLDFSAIDGELFSALVDTFSEWLSDVNKGRVSPRNEKEKRYWPENLRLLPDNIFRGFIDPYKIPTWHRYPKVVSIQHALYELSERLRVTPDAPNVRGVSLRVYRDWPSFFRQVSLNLSLTATSLRKAQHAAP